MNYSEELAFALSLADESRGLILKHFGTGLSVEWKGDNTPVTLADRAAEEAMRARMAKTTPGYGIIGEEFGKEVGTEDREWVIDPIDGTKAFIHGVPLFGTLIALLEKGEPVLGIIDLPALGERVYAMRGGGAFRVSGRSGSSDKSISGDANPCRVSSVNHLGDALILDGSTTTMESLGYGVTWGELRRKARLHRGWGDCYGHFLVATGGAEVMADPVVEIWDVAPMGVILPEAGGAFTGLLGTPGIGNRSGLSSNGLLHDVVTAALTADPV